MKQSISQFKPGDCGILNGKRFIVTKRVPEDRGSGGTTVEFEGGGTREFWWDHKDPEAEFIGRGTRRTVFEWPATASDQGEGKPDGGGR